MSGLERMASPITVDQSRKWLSNPLLFVNQKNKTKQKQQPENQVINWKPLKTEYNPIKMRKEREPSQT